MNAVQKQERRHLLRRARHARGSEKFWQQQLASSGGSTKDLRKNHLQAIRRARAYRAKCMRLAKEV